MASLRLMAVARAFAGVVAGPSPIGTAEVVSSSGGGDDGLRIDPSPADEKEVGNAARALFAVAVALIESGDLGRTGVEDPEGEAVVEFGGGQGEEAFGGVATGEDGRRVGVALGTRDRRGRRAGRRRSLRFLLGRGWRLLGVDLPSEEKSSHQRKTGEENGGVVHKLSPDKVALSVGWVERGKSGEWDKGGCPLSKLPLLLGLIFEVFEDGGAVGGWELIDPVAGGIGLEI